jgi:hypothetical protein
MDDRTSDDDEEEEQSYEEDEAEDKEKVKYERLIRAMSPYDHLTT